MHVSQSCNGESAEEFLEREYEARPKHEFVGGCVYRRYDETNQHATIAGNIFATLFNRVRGHGMRAWHSDAIIRIRHAAQESVYHPDVCVVTDSDSTEKLYFESPLLVAEVLSDHTHRIDHVEKKEAYLTITSLAVYLLVEQDSAKITVFRRTDHGFEPEVYQGLDAVVPLPEIDAELPLAAAYDRVEFVPEPHEQE